MNAAKVLIAVSAISLTSCATWSDFDQGLGALVGQPLSTAVARLGYPNSEQQVAGMRLVHWGRATSGAMLMPTTTTTTSTFYGSQGVASYTGYTTGNALIPINGNCRITLQVDQSETVRGYQYDGNMAGCETYIRAVKVVSVAPAPTPAAPQTKGCDLMTNNKGEQELVCP